MPGKKYITGWRVEVDLLLEMQSDRRWRRYTVCPEKNRSIFYITLTNSHALL